MTLIHLLLHIGFVMSTRRCTGLFLFFIAQVGLTQVGSYFPPSNGQWDRKLPSETGLDGNAIDSAISFALNNEYSGERDLQIAILKGFAREPYHYLAGPTKDRGGPSGIICKNGFIVASWGDVARVDMTFSVTKSYLSTVAGLAYDAGLIRSLDDPLTTYVWDGTFDGKHNASINWDHLLTQSSDWSGTLFGMKDWADRPPREGDVDDWKMRKLATPGTVYEYNDVRVNVLAYALLQVWRRSLPSVLKEKIMDPIGASTTWRWYGYENSYTDVDGYRIQSVSGGGHSGGGLFINTLDHARFGLLFLRKGNWEGKQLISEEWIEMATKPSLANDSYGYLWWLNRGNRYREGIPKNVFLAAGFGGNYIIIIPDHEMVLVTRWLQLSQMAEFVKRVLSAVK